MKIGDIGGVVAGLADDDAEEVLFRGVLLTPRRVLFGAPRVLLVAVVQEEVDQALPGHVLGPPQVGVGVVPALCRATRQGFTPEMYRVAIQVV